MSHVRFADVRHGETVYDNVHRLEKEKILSFMAWISVAVLVTVMSCLAVLLVLLPTMGESLIKLSRSPGYLVTVFIAFSAVALVVFSYCLVKQVLGSLNANQREMISISLPSDIGRVLLGPADYGRVLFIFSGRVHDAGLCRIYSFLDNFHFVIRDGVYTIPVHFNFGGDTRLGETLDMNVLENLIIEQWPTNTDTRQVVMSAMAQLGFDPKHVSLGGDVPGHSVSVGTIWVSQPN